jgi:IstB-like ATP binding protein
MREFTPQQADDLYELVSERTAHRGAMAITSNRQPSDWYPLFPNPIVAESLLDRLINNSHQLFMNGPSCRPNKRPGQTAVPMENKTLQTHPQIEPGGLRRRRQHASAICPWPSATSRRYGLIVPRTGRHRSGCDKGALPAAMLFRLGSMPKARLSRRVGVVRVPRVVRAGWGHTPSSAGS